MKCKRHTKNSEELDRLRTELISKVAAFLLRKNREATQERMKLGKIADQKK